MLKNILNKNKYNEMDNQFNDEIDSFEDIEDLENIEDTENTEEKTKEDLLEKVSMISDGLSQYYKSIAPYYHLSLAEEIELGKKIRQGDKEALNTLIIANLKFVVSVASKYKNTSVPLQDIISKGNIGLIEAAKRYNPDKNVKFITYAVWWIRQSILTGLSEQIASVKLPLKQANILYKINAVKEKLAKELRREPSTEEVSIAIDVPTDDIEAISRVAKGTVSLDNLISSDSNSTYLDHLESKSMAIEDIIMQKMLKTSVEEILSELDEREAEIITMRFGLNDEPPFTLEEVGSKLNISRERVRQLEVRALDKLKKKALKRKLKDYLN